MWRWHDRGLKPSFFTFVVSTFATILSTRVLRIVAKVLTTVTLISELTEEFSVCTSGTLRRKGWMLAIPDTKILCWINFVLPRQGHFGQMCQHVAVAATCCRHVGNFPSQCPCLLLSQLQCHGTLNHWTCLLWRPYFCNWGFSVLLSKLHRTCKFWAYLLWWACLALLPSAVLYPRLNAPRLHELAQCSSRLPA